MSLLNQYPCVNVSAPTYLSFATASFALLSGVVASVGNLLVVLAVFLDPHKELRSSFSYFVASLGFADLMVGLFAAPMGAVYPITAGLQQASQRFRVWMHLVYFISCTASLLSLTALALERYLAIKYPLLYRSKLNSMRAFFVSVVVWIISTLVTLLYFVVGYNKFRFVFANTAVVLTLTVLIFTNSKIFKYLRCQVHQWDRLHGNPAKNLALQRAIEREKRVTKTLLVNLILFLVFYLPSCVCIYIVNFCTNCDCLFIQYARKIQWVFVMANSGVNPFVYAWKLENFRKAFKSILKCQACSRRSSPDSTIVELTPSDRHTTNPVPPHE